MVYDVLDVLNVNGLAEIEFINSLSTLLSKC